MLIASGYTNNSSTLMTSEAEEEAIWLHGILYSIRTCFLPIIVLGTITNAFNFSILLRRDMRFLSTSVYLLALAIADMGVMYIELLRVWFEWADLVPPELYFSDPYCKVANFVNGVVRDFSNWLIACLTLERLMMVALPFKAKHFSTVSTARKLTLGLLVCLGLPHIHCLVFSVAIRDVLGWTCWEDRDRPTGVLIATIVDFVFGYLVIPVVFVLNILLIVMIYRSKLPFLRSSVYHKRSQTNRRLTRTLLLVAVVFLVCETPRMVMNVICRFLSRTTTRRIVLNLSYVLSGVNHACNFFIYILASPRFRHLVLKTFPFRLFPSLSEKKSSRCNTRRPTTSFYRSAPSGGAGRPTVLVQIPVQVDDPAVCPNESLELGEKPRLDESLGDIPVNPDSGCSL